MADANNNNNELDISEYFQTNSANQNFVRFTNILNDFVNSFALIWQFEETFQLVRLHDSMPDPKTLPPGKTFCPVCQK